MIPFITGMVIGGAVTVFAIVLLIARIDEREDHREDPRL